MVRPPLALLPLARRCYRYFPRWSVCPLPRRHFHRSCLARSPVSSLLHRSLTLRDSLSPSGRGDGASIAAKNPRVIPLFYPARNSSRYSFYSRRIQRYILVKCSSSSQNLLLSKSPLFATLFVSRVSMRDHGQEDDVFFLLFFLEGGMEGEFLFLVS